jgi:pimeloyl-ACP methyl ester carboxylesterase
MLDGSQFDGFDPDAVLAAIAAPVHLLRGEVELGGTIAADDAERLRSVARHYTRRTVSGVGHFIHHTAPAVFVDEIRDFTRRCT